ncbi:MAG: dephospho-CoA kinase [Arcobacter sp.]|nr:dephospho-CoA kinase [Arcobacter sp.]
MIIVGLTGGIGSGKTTVANFFKELGIPVYIADVEAKKLMNKSKVLQRKIKKLFGEEAYKNNELNRPFIASKIFNNEILLQEMNAIVHPKVGKHFKKWAEKQSAPYVIKEAAILFENNSYIQCDFVVTVIVDEEVRMQRILERDNTTKAKVRAIIDNQWNDEDKVKLSDFIIKNNMLKDTENQVLEIHRKLLKKIK